MDEQRYPLIVVPGSMASELYLGDDRIWPPDELSDYAKLRHLKGGALKVGQLVYVAQPFSKIGLGKVDIWKTFIEDFLVDELGYNKGEDLFTFPYDWRQDIRASGRRLRKALKGFADAVRTKRGIDPDQKVEFYLLGHGLGTTVCRWCVDQEGAKDRVARMMLVGPTDRGLPSTFITLSKASLDSLEGRLRSNRLVEFAFERMLPLLLGDPSDIIRSIESVYQTIPSYPFVFGPNGPIDIFEETSWLDDNTSGERQHWLAFLKAGKLVQQLMEQPPSVPTTYVYGMGKQTPESVYVKPRADGSYDWSETRVDMGRGDGIILSHSARPGDIKANVKVEWVEFEHNLLHNSENVKALLRNETIVPKLIDTGTDGTGISPEEIKTYMQSIISGYTFIAASKSHPGHRVVPLPAREERPAENVRAAIISARPGMPVVIIGPPDAGKSAALSSVMWHAANSSVQPGGEVLIPIYIDLRRFRSESNLELMIWDTLAEVGTKTFLEEQIAFLLESAPCLVMFNKLDRLLDRRPEKGMATINTFLKKYPNVRAVFACDSAAYDNHISKARVFMLLSQQIEQAAERLPQQLGDVIVAIIGDNASNIAIGRESGAKSIDVAAQAISRAETKTGVDLKLDREQLSKLVEASRKQEWQDVEAITKKLAESIRG